MPKQRKTIAVSTQGGSIHIPRMDSVDGRTKMARDVRDATAALVSDSGGSHTTAAQREIAHRAAIIGALCEGLEANYMANGQMDMGEYLPLCNAQRRLLATLGIRRHTATVPLASYIADKS